ncbi:MAG: hypothetical protein ACOCG5_04210 [Candidatus Alkaliphilus sp. MAG34]
MSYETRPQTYDETIKLLEKKDYRGIAEFILPSIKDAKRFPWNMPNYPFRI